MLGLHVHGPEQASCYYRVLNEDSLWCCAPSNALPSFLCDRYFESSHGRGQNSWCIDQ